MRLLAGGTGLRPRFDLPYLLERRDMFYRKNPGIGYGEGGRGGEEEAAEEVPLRGREGDQAFLHRKCLAMGKSAHTAAAQSAT